MGTRKRIRVLMVEDSENDAELVRLELERGGSFHVDPRRVDTRDSLEAALAQERFDLVIADFAMPQFDGLSAFSVVRERTPELPLIFVSGVLGEDRAVQAMRAGAHDYVVKSNLRRLVPAVQRALREREDRRQREAAERALAVEERRYRSIFETAAVALWEIDLSPLASSLGGPAPSEQRLGELARTVRVLDVNDAAVRLTRATAKDDLLGTLGELFADDSLEPWMEACRAIFSGEPALEREQRLSCRNGDTVGVLFCMRVPQRPDELQNVVVCMIDLTQRQRLEEQMKASQRMEAIGRLAGGVAHDFNNLLTVIRSFSESLRDNDALASATRDEAAMIQEAAERAAGLTNQLLAFGRQQARQIQTVDVSEVVRELERMLRRVIGEDVQLETSLSEASLTVDADPAQLEQIVMNLAVNARDAMPTGGTLRIETSSERLSAEACRVLDGELQPGHYVRLSVSDTGEGMGEATRERVFEPFFTTKESGRGTGLGLATIYGIVKQNAGHIEVESRLGHGTRFDIRLPASAGAQPAERRGDGNASDLHGAETVLLVEDDELVRRTVHRVLRRYGYRVLVAEGGAKALELCAQHDGPIDVLVTDLVMPESTGRDVARQVTAARPGIAVVYMSGHSDDAIAQRGALEQGAAYLQKPFAPKQLARSVRETLRRQRGSG